MGLFNLFKPKQEAKEKQIIANELLKELSYGKH